MSQLSEKRLLIDIIKHLPIEYILKTCASLTPNEYQTVCKNNDLWRYLLYRDYKVFTPIINKLERESYMSYFDLYREFYESEFFNSPDFTNLYTLLLEYVPLVEFLDPDGNITYIPTLVDTVSYSSRNKCLASIRFSNFAGDEPPNSILFITNDKINQAIESSPIFENVRTMNTKYHHDNTQTFKIPVTIADGNVRFYRGVFSKYIVDKYQR